MLKRITLDTNCMHPGRRDDSVSVIEQWRDDGKFVIERAPVMLEELARQYTQQLPQHPLHWRLSRSGLGVDTTLSGPDLEGELTRTLFPTTATLNKGQRADVEHLRSHVLSGPDAFITSDRGDFISHRKSDRRKQEHLRRFGIWVFEPVEFVRLCRAVYRWV